MEDKKNIFIEKAKKVHGDKYDYSKVEYVNSQTKVCIICPEHGEFWQIPSSHIRGYKCPKCANYNRGSIKRLDLTDFIKRAKEIHGDKYDYSKVEYVNAETKVCIICPKHGEFWQTPTAHLFQKSGCPKCKNKNLTKDELIEKFKEVHGDKYDYSKFELNKMNDKSIIICPEHGKFLQSATKHLIGQGCPECGKWKNRHETSKETFIERAQKVHGNKYDYSSVVLKGLCNKVNIICPKHGLFKQNAYDHINGHGCPYCGMLISNSEIEIYEYLCNILGKENVIHHDRTVLGDGKEIDIYIPKLKFGIEYDGLKWHSDEYKTDKNYHLKKTEACNKIGIKLIHIFEDEYKFSKDIVLSKLKHLLFADNLPKIPARKCQIKKIDFEMAKKFLNCNHIQGYTKSTIYYGAFLGCVLVGVMCFLKEKDNNWLLTRFATDIKFICQGIGGKLFKTFIREYNPEKIKTFADRRWTMNEKDNLYTILGFKLVKTLKPDYRYIKNSKPEKRIHKFNLRKKILNKFYNLPMTMTESEMTKKLGYSRIWDCGLYKYEWTKKSGKLISAFNLLILIII